MMKKFFCLSFLCLCLTINIKAQTLHAIVFADTNDPNIGIFDKQDYTNITLEVNTIASATSMKLKKYFYKDDACSITNLTNTLENLRTESDDVVIFYYSGHGIRSIDDKSSYPQMCLGSHYQQNFYPLEKVLFKLKQQTARLKIVIGDCCNSIGSGVSPKDYATKGATILTKEPVNTYNNLFMNYKGIIIATGSQQGENSGTVSWKDGSPAGGAFTICLLTVLQGSASNGLETNWEEILEVTKQTTKQLRPHTPIYDINVQPINNEHQNTTPQNQASATSDDEEIDRIELLTAIGNEANSIDERIQIKDAALKYVFATPETKVEIVGRNGTTIVATEKAIDFMIRLCTTHNLINLVEVDSQKNDNGQYTYLKIHEIYKK